MTTCHQVRQKYPATSAGNAANGSMTFVTKIIKATFKSNSGIAALPPIATPIGQNTALAWFSMLTLVSASKADNPDSFAVFYGEDCVGHIMRTQKSPPGKPWFWTIFVSDRHSSTVDRGYAATREQAMADFEAQWLRLPRSVEKERASGTIRPRLVTQTPHQKSTQLN